MSTTETADFFSRLAPDFARQYQTSPDFRARFDLWCELITRHGRDKRTAFDAGCGPGFFSFFMAEKGMRVVGVDASDQMIVMCDKRRAETAAQNVEFHLAQLPMTTPIVAGPFDIVISSSVLEYIAAMPEALSQLSGLLSPGGIMIVSMPNRESWYRRLERVIFRLFRYPPYSRYVKNNSSPAELRRLVEPMGLTHLETHYYAHAPLLSRAMRKCGFSARLTENLFVSVFQKKA